MTFKNLSDPSAGKRFLMTNEAIARAAMESDVKVSAFYPGSPTSEILNSMYRLSGVFPDLKMEVSINEKVALETVAGASMAGARSLTAMKSVGLNVASDTFYSLGYVGVNAGCVLVFADDPHAHSSQSEQDGRYFAQTAHVPMLEPSTPQEAYEMTKYAYELSEKHRILTLIRTTTRVNHQNSAVSVGEINRTPFEKKNWKDVKASYFTLGETARRLKSEALVKLNSIKKEFDSSPFNIVVEGKDKVGIITNGVSYLHTLEAVKCLGIEPKILRLGTLYPVPDGTITKFIDGLDKLVVIEELLPYIEDIVTPIALKSNASLEIIGKNSGHFPTVGEYNTGLVTETLSQIYGVPNDIEYSKVIARATELKEILPNRLPSFCPGCPHRGTMWSVQQALKGMDYVINNDIGCYSMLLLEPYGLTDSVLAMGASQGLSSGMQHVLNDRVVSFLGDSTFFHAALPGIVNAIHNNHDYTVIILDNKVTAMTGQQPNPGSDFGAAPVTEIDIEAVLRGFGVKNITMISAFDPQPNVETIKDVINKPGFNAIISVGPCALYNDRKKRQERVPITPNRVDKETCKTIYACVRDFYCPAIQLNMETRQAEILEDLCNGCGNCGRLCPRIAIASTGGAE
jgi:indolepyruvate ferredoxin oxidoreductase alpha subunit